MTKALSKRHDVGDDMAYNEKTHTDICQKYKQICKKVDFANTISITDKLEYQSIIIYILTHIDTNAKLAKSLITQIRNIEINNSSEKKRGGASRNEVIIRLARVETRREFREVLSHEL